MLELNPRPAVSPSRDRRDAGNKQARRLLIALALLLIALIAIVMRDQDFWFGADDTIADSDVTDTAVAPQKPASIPVANAARSIRPATTAVRKPIVSAKTAAEQATSVPKASNSSAITATRTVLPPLDVEVVAGDSHRTIRPGSNTTKLEINRPGYTGSSALARATNAAEREQIPAGMGSYEANYPPLAQHMNVEGSVVLQALISAEGMIENLRVLGGPAILATAAQQAVREWKFKPVIQNGQAVETKAMITVNFTIKVADNASKDELASSMPLRYSYTYDGASR
jgi:TonB family protein